jgi:ribulose-5-phosphate 4-epimerase/fuculose-1-phosphate aldolase
MIRILAIAAAVVAGLMPAAAQEAPASAVALMRGHGNVVVGPNVRIATSRAVFTDENARMQSVALSFGGPVNYISDEEGALRDANASDGARSWDLWKAQALKKMQ